MATVKLVRRLANPARKRRLANPARKSRRRVANPALVLTLGAVNPKKRRVRTMRKRNAVRRRRKPAPMINFIAPVSRRRNRRRYGRRRNPVVVRYSRRRGRRRNPLFPGVTLAQVMGGLLGVAATRFVGALIPAQLTSFAGTSAPLVKDLVAGALVAWGGQKIGSGGMKGDIAVGVSFGALMQVASTGVQTFFPALRTYGIGISGMGYMMPARFPVPQNPLAIPAPVAPAGVSGRRVTTNGIQRAFSSAF